MRSCKDIADKEHKLGNCERVGEIMEEWKPNCKHWQYIIKPYNKSNVNISRFYIKKHSAAIDRAASVSSRGNL